MRSTENKLIDIPLTTGMNQAMSPRLAPTGTLYEVQNCRISGNGILEKRPGSIALAATTVNAGGAAFHAHSLQGDGVNFNIENPAFACQVQGALLVGNTSGDAFAYSTQWQFQGRFSTCLPVRKRYGLALDDLYTLTGFGGTPPDIAVSASGYICVAALTGTGILHCYIEDAVGIRIYYLQSSGPYARVRLVAQGDVILLVTQPASPSTAINATPITIANGTATAGVPVAVGTLFSTDSNWDVCPYDSTGWYLIRQSATTTMFMSRKNITAIVASGSFTVTGKPPVAIWADAVSKLLWVGYYDNPTSTGDVAYTVWDISVPAAFTSVKTKTILKTALNCGPPLFGRLRGHNPSLFPSAGFYVFAQYALASGVVATWTGLEQPFIAGVGAGGVYWHVLPLGKPDDYNRVWCQVQTYSDNQLLTKNVLLRFGELAQAPPTVELSAPNMPNLASAFRPLLTNTWFVGNGGLGASRSYMPVPLHLQQFYGENTIVTFDVYEYTTAEQESHRAAIGAGISTVIVGQPVEFWAQSVSVINTDTSAGDISALPAGAAEIGFPHAPTIVSATVNAALGTPIVPGTRSYKCVFEWIDMYGRRHQSAPSAPVSLTNGTATGVTLLVTDTEITQRQAANTTLRAYLRVYRTVNGGTDYNELALTISAFSSGTGLLTFNDVETDANISQDAFIYTDGGALDHDLAPACRFTCKAEDRLWFGGLWDSTIVQCSKVIVPGEPLQCTDDASHQVQLPGLCTGLAYMDGNVLAFTADAIYLISGDGPNDQGAGSFPSPRALTRSLGCCDYRSIVETNVGVIFQSNLGFYIVPRGFGPVQYVGMAVQDEMSEQSDMDPVVLGAISHQTRDNHVVRFLVAPAGGTNSQTVLTYDLDSNQWYKDTLPFTVSELGAFDSLQASGSKGAVFVRSDLSSVDNSNPVWIESPTTGYDASPGVNDVPQRVQTAWIHPFGLGGWGKVNVVMVAVEAIGASQTLTLTVSLDDGSTQVGTWVITAPGLVSYRALYVAAPHACTSIQITIDGAASTDPGGFKLISLSLEVEPTNGLRLMLDSEKN